MRSRGTQTSYSMPYPLTRGLPQGPPTLLSPAPYASPRPESKEPLAGSHTQTMVSRLPRCQPTPCGHTWHKRMHSLPDRARPGPYAQSLMPTHPISRISLPGPAPTLPPRSYCKVPLRPCLQSPTCRGPSKIKAFPHGQLRPASKVPPAGGQARPRPSLTATCALPPRSHLPGVKQD